MKKPVIKKRGFTLIEVIVAFSVIIMVILASTNLLVSIIRSNTDNVNRLVAYGLAQEALEGVRNMRDSDWLLGAGFDGNVGTDCVWGIQNTSTTGGCLPAVSDKKMDFLIDFFQPDISGSADSSPDIASIRNSYSPWRLQDVTQALKNKPFNEFLTGARLCLFHPLQNPAQSWYHTAAFCSTQSGTTDQTVFSRYVEIQALPYETGDAQTAKKYRVSAVVDWPEQGQIKGIRLTTEITDWKGGPL
jgi:type II secretory pathway pseudopilin PulG